MTEWKKIQVMDHQSRHMKNQSMAMEENMTLAERIFNTITELNSKIGVEKLSREQELLLARGKSWMNEMIDITFLMSKVPDHELDIDDESLVVSDDTIEYDFTDTLPDERVVRKRLRKEMHDPDYDSEELGKPKKYSYVIINTDDIDDVIL
jgi:hypothetical protein